MTIIRKSWIVALIGLSVTVLGVIMSFCWNGVFNIVISKGFRLTPTSKLFELWRDMPIPLQLGVYFFNWTNPEEIFNEGFKPKFVEMGPYTFREVFTKDNVTWNDNGTISYRNHRVWHFDPENSVGPLTDNITTLNPVPLSAAYASRYYNYFLKLAISSTIRISQQKIWITKTVGEFTFDGYADPLMTLASAMPLLQKSGVTGSKFSWFINRNDSSDYEGVYNMETGEDDSSRTGIMREWNYKNRTDFFRAECGIINGSDGVLFNSGHKRGNPIEVFSSDFCKSVKLEYLEDTEYDGVQGFRYVGTKMLLDNGDLDPNNWCNCDGICLPHGALNISACHYGAPGFVSYPHFLHADPYYLNNVEGLHPEELKHRFDVILEPRSGFPLRAFGRAQLNILLQPHEHVSLYRNVPTIVFPMLWLEKSATIPHEYMTYLKILLAIPDKGIYFSIAVIVVGVIMLTASLVRTIQTRNSRKLARRQKSYIFLQRRLMENTKGNNEDNILLEEKDKK